MKGMISMNGNTTRSLLSCIENGVLNTPKFFKMHPLNDSLKQDLIVLRDQGYISFDYGDNKIVVMDANQKLLDLLKEDL